MVVECDDRPFLHLFYRDSNLLQGCYAVENVSQDLISVDFCNSGGGKILCKIPLQQMGLLEAKQYSSKAVEKGEGSSSASEEKPPKGLDCASDSKIA